MMLQDLWQHLGLRMRSRRRRKEAAVLFRQGRAQGGWDRPRGSRGESAAGAELGGAAAPGIQQRSGCVGSHGMVELALFDHHHCAGRWPGSGRWPGGSWRP